MDSIKDHTWVGSGSKGVFEGSCVMCQVQHRNYANSSMIQLEAEGRLCPNVSVMCVLAVDQFAGEKNHLLELIKATETFSFLILTLKFYFDLLYLKQNL